jgi:hypothetical protein
MFRWVDVLYSIDIVVFVSCNLRLLVSVPLYVFSVLSCSSPCAPPFYIQMYFEIILFARIFSFSGN